MKTIQRTLTMIFIIVAIAFFVGCSSKTEMGEGKNQVSLKESRDAHDREGGESRKEGRGEHRGGEEPERKGYGEHGRGGEKGGDGHEEESGEEFGLNDTYDQVRNGARLILSYDAESNSFIGTVENTTKKTLKRVRVEVHLSNGIELGPTTPTNLRPGEKRKVKLAATSKPFERWGAHPEVGSGEESGGEHGESGEHSRSKESKNGENHN